MVAKTAENRRPRALRMSFGEESGDAGAHRIAHDVRGRDLQIIKQRPRILGHLGHCIVGGIVKLLAAAVSAIIEGDDPPTVFGQGFNPLRGKTS